MPRRPPSPDLVTPRTARRAPDDELAETLLQVLAVCAAFTAELAASRAD